MRSQIKLGRICGIEIGLHYSWFLIALLIVFSLFFEFHTNNPQWGNGLILSMAVATAILFFVSLLLHELAVPAKKSVLVETIALAKSLRVAFPGHVEPNFFPGRLFSSPFCSASRDSCSPSPAFDLAAFQVRP
jgi:Zn-dependent protease